MAGFTGWLDRSRGCQQAAGSGVETGVLRAFGRRSAPISRHSWPPSIAAPLRSAACADNFNWCFVPLSGSDAFLFVSLALIACGCLFGKLSAVWVLVAGASKRLAVGAGGCGRLAPTRPLPVLPGWCVELPAALRCVSMRVPHMLLLLQAAWWAWSTTTPTCATSPTASRCGWASPRPTSSSTRYVLNSGCKRCCGALAGAVMAAAPGCITQLFCRASGRPLRITQPTAPALLPQFLPPLLVDSAIRIDFFMFSKVTGSV